MNLRPNILLLLPAFFTGMTLKSSAQTTPPFVQRERITVSNITTDAETYTLPITQKQTSRTYFDGLARPMQAVGVQATPLQNDVIQPIAYDALGRQTTGYLPYGGASTDVMGSYRSNAISTAQPAFYNNTTQHVIPVDADAYSAHVFENSPLQRLLQAGMDGSGFQPTSGQHYKTVSYRPNSSSTDGNIMEWNTNGTYTSGTYYSASSLWVTDAVDEDGIEVRIFKDYNGHTVLKRQILSGGNLDTYYIYNNAGLISYVIPPLALANLGTSYSLTTAPVSNLIFSYGYDAMGRMITKTVPGGVAITTIYDPYNRPILMQNAAMAANNQWNYVKYDVKSRVICQGIYTDATHFGQSVMQNYVNTTYTNRYEIRSTTPSYSGYYTNQVFPTSSIQALSYQYYDNYTLTTGTTYSYYSTGLPGEVGATTAQVKGMPTITQESTVSNTVTPVWLTKVQFYDQNLHPIQAQSNNLMYSSSTPTDYTTQVPDFTGMPLTALATKKSSSTTTTSVKTVVTYDQAYRVTAVDQYYNGSNTVSHVAAYSYNELGQVIQKQLGYVTTNTWIQYVDFRYNIRGQVLSINNSKLSNDAGVTNNDNLDVFGMTFLYDGSDATLNNGAGNVPKYDGRLSAVKWMSKDGVGYERSYVYAYDGVNRYAGETYSERTAASAGNFSNNVHGFDETGITYDAGGNILTLQRNSSVEGTNTYTQIDNLTYSYKSTTTPNEIATVTDGTTSNYTGYGFRNLTGSTTGYVYDGNGNLTNDYYKGLTIGYNVANRTDKITVTTGSGQYINYVYDASGQLIRKLEYSSGTLQTTTDYLDGFVFVNGTLSFFNMPEGRVINNSGTLVQEYVITDAQGNARVSFQNSGGVASVKQENSYYGFGLLLPNSIVGMSTPPNRFMYKGSEWQNDYSNLPDYYQTFYRNYDAALGRFVSTDPEPESAESMNNYQYADNNPIMNVDPLGNTAAAGKPTHATDGQLYFPSGNPNSTDDGCGGPSLEDQLQSEIASTVAEEQAEEAALPPSSLGAYLVGLGQEVAQAINGTNIAGVQLDVSTIQSNPGNTLSINSDGSVTEVYDPGDGTTTNGSSGNSSATAVPATAGSGSSTGAGMDSSDQGGGASSAGQGSGGNLFQLPGTLPPYDSHTQIGALCNFYSVAEAWDYETGDSITGIGIFDDYATNHLTTAQINQLLAPNSQGINAEQVFSNYLYYQPTNNVIQSLISGHPVLASVKQTNDCFTGNHEVFITGFSYFFSGPQAGFNYTFFNSQTNQFQNLSPSQFSDTQEIDGVQL